MGLRARFIQQNNSKGQVYIAPVVSKHLQNSFAIFCLAVRHPNRHIGAPLIEKEIFNEEEQWLEKSL
jgi:hypothetical protein